MFHIEWDKSRGKKCSPKLRKTEWNLNIDRILDTAIHLVIVFGCILNELGIAGLLLLKGFSIWDPEGGAEEKPMIKNDIRGIGIGNKKVGKLRWRSF